MDEMNNIDNMIAVAADDHDHHSVHLDDLDPETAFIYNNKSRSKEEEDESRNWELFKENVRPLKRGRNISLLNHALQKNSITTLSNIRSEMIQQIHDYSGDDPLLPWIRCIKWIQDSFPSGGDSSGLLVIYEQCVRTFWHDPRYKDDLRYLKVWLEYADYCNDAHVIFNFLEANGIGQTHSLFYISYAAHLESISKIATANEVFNRGLARNAQPIHKLQAAFHKFLARSLTRPNTNNNNNNAAAVDENFTENLMPNRSFGTVLNRGENRRTQDTVSSAMAKKKLKSNGVGGATSFAIFKDENGKSTASDHPTELPKGNMNIWHSLGTQAQRNKENTAVPDKWTSYKIPQKPIPRGIGASPAPVIEVYVDDASAKLHKAGAGEDVEKSSSLQFTEGDSNDKTKEMAMLRKNPLRNFPPNSLPR